MKTFGANGIPLMKSEQKSQKKYIAVVWIITFIFLVTCFVSFVVDYGGYREGQEFGLASMIMTTSGLTGSFHVDKNDTYAEQCKDAYSILTSNTPDFSVYGKDIDNSALRRAERAQKDSFADLMENAGYDRYSSYSIQDWFKYTNMLDYFVGYYWNQILPISSYAILLFAVLFTILKNKASQKELIVYDDSVLCRTTKKKTKQLIFEDISNVDLGKNSLKLVGTGLKFKISNATNADAIKSLIMEKKKASQKQNAFENARVALSSAEELKKYKELLDQGVISPEEFERKKEQLLKT